MSAQITSRLLPISWRIMFIIALLAGMFTAPPPAFAACTCGTIDAPPAAYQNADAVFVGTVLSEFDYGRLSYAADQEIEFAVRRSWRGLISSRALVLSGGPCYYLFDAGTEYLVYAYEDNEGVLRTDTCTRTVPLAEAAQDLDYLAGFSTLPLFPTYLWKLTFFAALLFVVRLWQQFKARRIARNPTSPWINGRAPG